MPIGVAKISLILIKGISLCNMMFAVSNIRRQLELSTNNCNISGGKVIFFWLIFAGTLRTWLTM